MNLKEKTVVIDNKIYHYSKIVMLGTREPSILMLEGNDLLYSKRFGFDKFDHNKNFRHTNKQHLYFLSTDKICEGDWCIRDTQVFKATNIINGDIEFIDEDGQLMHYGNWACTKIIASTNPSLNLPKPSEQFLQVYIDAYNKGEKIEECFVEYEPHMHKAKMPKNFMDYIEPGQDMPIIADSEEVATWKLKVTKGEITIRKIKDSYSKSDFMNALHKVELKHNKDYSELWNEIEQNL